MNKKEEYVSPQTESVAIDVRMVGSADSPYKPVTPGGGGDDGEGPEPDPEEDL